MTDHISDTDSARTITDEEGYWAAVIGASRDALAVAVEFDLADSSVQAVTEWLSSAESVAIGEGYRFDLDPHVRYMVISRLCEAIEILVSDD